MPVRVVNINCEYVTCQSSYLLVGRGVCAGDAGAGLFFQSNQKFYLRGIASSMMVTSEGCEINNYAQYTRVSHYLSWIKAHMAKNDKIRMNFKTRVGGNLDIDKSEGCSLPPHILYGRFSLPNNLPYIAYQIVPQSSVLYLTCTNRTSDVQNFYCIDNQWERLANATCPAPGKFQEKIKLIYAISQNI